VPHNDYTDTELEFPRLEARIQKVADDAFWITIWLWEKAGDERKRIENGKRAGSFEDAKEIIQQRADELGVIIEPDDITVD
jgi:hypothetical protein